MLEAVGVKKSITRVERERNGSLKKAEFRESAGARAAKSTG